MAANDGVIADDYHDIGDLDRLLDVAGSDNVADPPRAERIAAIRSRRAPTSIP
jgi:hypothetical protein